MTNLYEQQPCERFAPLISAMIDGELEQESAVQLNEHLDTCSACRERMSSYQEIDGAIFSEAESFLVDPIPASMESNWNRPAEKSEDSVGGSILRLIPFGIAAAVLVGLAMTTIPSARSTVTAEQIAQPLAELELIDMEHRANQARMLKIIELDLRALRVELGQLGNNESQSAKKQRLEQHLAKLIDRVSEMEEKTAIESQ